jgi:hypothetical protein
MTIPSLFDHEPPAHARDPYSSRQAASKTRTRAASQSRSILRVVVEAGPDGATTRHVQRRLYSPAQAAWNKVPTRLLELARKGLVEREPDTRIEDHREDGAQHFLVYRATRAGIDHIGWDHWPS